MGIKIVLDSLKQILLATDTLYNIVKTGKETTLLSFVEKYAKLNNDFAHYLSQIYNQEIDFENITKNLFKESKDV